MQSGDLRGEDRRERVAHSSPEVEHVPVSPARKYSAGMNRREFLAGIAVAPLAASPLRRQAQTATPQGAAPARQRAKLKQSVMASVWGMGSTLSFEERCKVLARIGFKGVDLPTPEQAPMLKQYGLAPALMPGAGTTFQDGLIRKELHDKFEAVPLQHRRLPWCGQVESI